MVISGPGKSEDLLCRSYLRDTQEGVDVDDCGGCVGERSKGKEES